jgi:hypothetical protein
MFDFDEVKSRIQQVISEVKDILDLFDREMSDPRKRFQAAKEIEMTIERFKRQGLPVPEELNRLKLQMAANQREDEQLVALYEDFLNTLSSLSSSRVPNRPADLGKGRKTGQPGHLKPPEYEKPLGTKGYSNLEDYLIPVIKLVWEGHDHKAAFRQIAHKLDVRYNTVSAQCTRTLGLTTEEFVRQVQEKTIIQLLSRKYSIQYQSIRDQLER